jgi:MFS family permease
MTLVTPLPAADPTARNIVLLSLALSLGMSSGSLVVSSAGIVGHGMVADDRWATLPVACYYLAGMLTALPASLTMRHLGRKGGFLVGLGVGAVGALVSCAGVMWQSFAVFCAGTLLLGSANAFVPYYRLAATDTAKPAFRATAISLVMAGGVLSAFIGPTLARYGKDALTAYPFAGTFLSLLLPQAVALLMIVNLRIPPANVIHRSAGRPLREVVRQPTFLAAIAASGVGYGLMSLLMVSTPLAVLGCGYAFADATQVIQWHIVGMYLPAFISGPLIRRIGEVPVILMGLACYGLTVAIGAAGTSLYGNFTPALVLLGVGWSFLYVAGSTLLTRSYRPEEKARVEGLHDMVVFSAVALAAAVSGSLYFSVGWTTLTLLLLPPMIIVLAATGLLARQRDRSS